MRRRPSWLAAALASSPRCGSSDGAAHRRRPAAAVAASRKASAPGITATTVTVGGHFPLTGPAAPGYSEIPRAIDAYFQHVNANGGVNGRKLKFIVRDDGYNPTNTVKVTKQLVLQDKVFAIARRARHADPHQGRRLPQRLARARTSSSPPAAAAGTTRRSTRTRSAGSPTTSSRARSSASTSPSNFKGKKVAYFLQNDDFGTDGADGPGHVRAQGPTVVARQTYEPGNTDIGPQMAKIKASRRRGRGVVHDPRLHRAAAARRRQARLPPDDGGQQRRLATRSTLTGLLKAFSKGKAGASLIDGIVTDSYLPPLGRRVQQLDQAVQADPRPVHPEAADGRQRRLRHGAGLHVRGGARQGRARTRRASRSSTTIEKGGLTGPGLVPFRFSADSHAGYTGVQVGKINEGVFKPEGKPMTTDDASGEISEYTEAPTEAPAERRSVPRTDVRLGAMVVKINAIEVAEGRGPELEAALRQARPGGRGPARLPGLRAAAPQGG